MPKRRKRDQIAVGEHALSELFEEPLAKRSLGIAVSEGAVTSLDSLFSSLGNRIFANLAQPVIQGLAASLAETAAYSVKMALQQALKSIFKEYEVTYKIILASYFRPFQDVLLEVGKSFRTILDKLSKLEARMLEDTLCSHRWWPVPGLPFEFYEGILILIENGETRRVNRYICAWFRWNRYRRLTRMAKRWDDNRYFRRRRPIYRQALKGHRRRLYNLTVPGLVPLVEGIARDYLWGEHGISERRGLTAIKEALSRNIPDDVYQEELQQILIRFLTSSTFADTDRDDVLTSGYELNRHGVAHSRHIRYGSEANSLRCFLLLETLYRFISDDPGTAWS